MRAARSHVSWGWAGLGFAGSLSVALAGSDILRGKPVIWFFSPHLPAPTVIFYVGIAALCVAWLGIGRGLGRPGGASTRELLMIGALWCVPLALAPALFSRDLYSYLADGSILHAGLNPYHQAPDVLGRLHQTRLMDAVSPFWRHTTAPYGPSFLGIAALISGLVGSHLVAGVLLLRAVEVGGVVLVAIFVPRLARALGADPARAVWLAVIGPLILLELIGAGHNDALMAGLLVAGVTLAVERRPLAGIALCALAVALCYRVRRENLVWYLGLLLLAAVLGGPAAWPWYLIWGLALLASCEPAQRWRWLPLVLIATAFLVRADGQLILPRSAAPVMLALYAVAVLAVATAWRRSIPPALSSAEFAR